MKKRNVPDCFEKKTTLWFSTEMQTSLFCKTAKFRNMFDFLAYDDFGQPLKN